MFFFFIELKTLSVSQLNELYMELELLIRDYSETLISELALRDELEYEKELKNTFISLLLAVQNRRRQHHVEKKKNKSGGKTSISDSKVSKLMWLHQLLEYAEVMMAKCVKISFTLPILSQADLCRIWALQLEIYFMADP